jgi:hypothetical protein
MTPLAQPPGFKGLGFVVLVVLALLIVVKVFGGVF